ncbi:MAG TPA: alpha/beta hydrolase [Gemmatimonadales bacterium]|nr:alpha/beta hydrolase [Gemmatimonadales bacterium]
MRSRSAMLIAGLAAGAGLGAIAPLRLEAQEPGRNVLGIDRPGTADVAVDRGRRYRDTLTMDVYRPRGASKPVPAVVFVHGGLVAGAKGTSPTTWPIYQSWGRLAAADGLAGVTFNHRLTTNDNVAETEPDVEAAIAHVRANAKELGIDPERLCLAFYSAGGVLAGSALREPRPFVRCVVLFYPYLDLEHLRMDTRFRRAYAASRVDSLAPRYSPAAQLGRDPSRLPPIFLAMAGHDEIPGLNASIRRFVAAAVDQRAPMDLLIHPTGRHGFDEADHDQRTRDILEHCLTFLHRHLGR